MAAEKTVALSLRVSPQLKTMLEVAAAQEHRSLTNMVETLVLAHCAQNAIKGPPAKKSKSRGCKA